MIQIAAYQSWVQWSHGQGAASHERVREIHGRLSMFGETVEELQCRRNAIEAYLNEREFELHPKKTRIYPIKDGIKFLGFTHRLTSTGKVIRIIDPNNVKQERKKLRRMVGLVKKGKMTRKKVDECFKAWKAHAEKGNSTKLINRMNKYYADLWKEEQEHEHDQEKKNCERTEKHGGACRHSWKNSRRHLNTWRRWLTSTCRRRSN